MRQNKSKYLLGLILIFNLTFAGMCGGGDPKAKQIVRAEDDFAQGLKTTANILKECKTDGSISQADIDFLKPILLEVSNTHLRIIKLTEEIIALGDSATVDKQKELLEQINFISDNLTTLNNEGILRIKNESHRILFNATILTMQSAVTSFVIVLNLKGN